MSKTQYFGIKYPFQNEDAENYFVDLNNSPRDKVRSEMMHVMFTPKGQKLRDPEFGTNLIHYIFEPNDAVSWNNIKKEISSAVGKYVPRCVVNDIQILKNEDNPSETFVRIDYGVKEGNIIIDDTVITKL